MEWCKRETSNYVINYKVGSIAEREIQKIANIQESCYKFITDSLGVYLDHKINYYLCDTSIEVGNIYGDLYGDYEPCNGFARDNGEIYAVYNEVVKCIGFHEDAHIVSYKIARPKQTFFREGLAMYFDKNYCKIPNYCWVNYFISEGLYVDIPELLDNDNFYKYSDEITYPIAGAFIEYLIALFGMKRSLSFYKNVQEAFNETSKENFNRTIEELNNSFKEYLCCISTNVDISNLIVAKIKERNILSGK